MLPYAKNIIMRHGIYSVVSKHKNCIIVSKQKTSVQSNLAKGRIADLSSLAAANGCVRR